MNEMKELMSFINKQEYWDITKSTEVDEFKLVFYVRNGTLFNIFVKGKDIKEFLSNLNRIQREFDVSKETYASLDKNGYGPDNRGMKEMYEGISEIPLELNNLWSVLAEMFDENPFIKHAKNLGWKVGYRDNGFLLSTFVQPHDQIFQVYFDGDIESKIERLISTECEVIKTREEIIGKLIELSPASKLNNNKYTLDNIMNTIHDMGCDTDLRYLSRENLYAFDIWFPIDNQLSSMSFKFHDVESFFTELKKAAQNTKERNAYHLHFYYKLIKRLGGY